MQFILPKSKIYQFKQTTKETTAPMFWPCMFILLTSIWQIFIFAQADEPTPRIYSPTELGQTPIPPDHIRLWFDEARAQREFIAARRRAAKKNANAHLRAIDPWIAERIEGAAHEAELRRDEANQRHKSAEDKHRARMDILERRLPPYYMPYPCLYYEGDCPK